MENSCTSVTTPATNMAFCSRLTCRSANSPPARPQALVMIRSGVRLPTNMANTCCRPSGMAWRRGILASNWYAPFSNSIFLIITSPLSKRLFYTTKIIIAEPFSNWERSGMFFVHFYFISHTLTLNCPSMKHKIGQISPLLPAPEAFEAHQWPWCPLQGRWRPASGPGRHGTVWRWQTAPPPPVHNRCAG